MLLRVEERGNGIETASDGYIVGQTEKYRRYLDGSLKKFSSCIMWKQKSGK